VTQQLQLSQSEVECSTTELTAKIKEHAKYRRAEHAKFTTPQVTHDAFTRRHSSSESALKALQTVHSSQMHQLTALSCMQELTGQFAEQEAAFTSETSELQQH